MKMTQKLFSEIGIGQQFVEGNGNYWLWNKIEVVNGEHSETGKPSPVNACLSELPWFATFFPENKVVILCESDNPV